jgi:hypothetical protein
LNVLVRRHDREPLRERQRDDDAIERIAAERRADAERRICSLPRPRSRPT